MFARRRSRLSARRESRTEQVCQLRLRPQLVHDHVQRVWPYYTNTCRPVQVWVVCGSSKAISHFAFSHRIQAHRKAVPRRDGAHTPDSRARRGTRAGRVGMVMGYVRACVDTCVIHYYKLSSQDASTVTASRRRFSSISICFTIRSLAMRGEVSGDCNE